MTKKHFVALAAVLKSQRPHGMDANTLFGSLPQWNSDVQAMANFCQSQNAQFDRERFLAACGVRS